MSMWMAMARQVAVVMAVGAVGLGSADALAKKGGKKVLTGVVNLNTATAAQLDLLPGVGEKAADRIIEHRSKTPFTRVEELVKVKGFGKKSFERVKPYLAVSGPTTLQEAKGLPMPAMPPLEAQGRASPKR